MTKIICAVLAGIVFAVGLVLSGMLQPAKVQGFLNIAGVINGISWHGARGFWDPSLALVMAGALTVTFFGFRFTSGSAEDSAKPWAADAFDWPADSKTTKRLIVGSALFGIGWALAGYCPGPALASLSSSTDAAVFVCAMLAAMWTTKQVLMRMDGELPAAQPQREDDED